MKNASANLITLLASSRELIMIDVYTFTLADGTVIELIDGDEANGTGAATDEFEPELT